MPKNWSASHVFFIFAVLFSLSLLRGPTDLLICGAAYAFVDAFVLPKSVSVKSIFPLGMLFLFLLILSEVPEKVYTATLYYTVRGLIVFRSLMLLLSEVQESEEKTSKALIATVVGFALELSLVAVLLYSSFKHVDPTVLKWVGFLSLKGLLVLTGPLIYQRLSFKNGEVIS